MTVRADVVYARHGDRAMHLDVYEPSGPLDRRTAILVHHGGGWRMGDRKVMGPRCEALAARGFTAIAVEYRTTGEAPWPAQLQDVKAAARWSNDNAATLGVDRVVLQGHSAGAHLALIAAGSAALSTVGVSIDVTAAAPARRAHQRATRLQPLGTRDARTGRRLDHRSSIPSTDFAATIFRSRVLPPPNRRRRSLIRS